MSQTSERATRTAVPRSKNGVRFGSAEHAKIRCHPKGSMQRQIATDAQLAGSRARTQHDHSTKSDGFRRWQATYLLGMSGERGVRSLEKSSLQSALPNLSYETRVGVGIFVEGSTQSLGLRSGSGAVTGESLSARAKPEVRGWPKSVI